MSKNKKEHRSVPSAEKHIDTLLYYIESFNWQTDGTSIHLMRDVIPIEYKPLFDALTQVKHDVDRLLKTKNEAESHLAEQNKFNKLRAEIWKTASDKSLKAEVLIQKLLDAVGPAIGVSRACYNQYTNNDPNRNDLICTIEWCANGVKPSLGTRIPNYLVKLFDKRDVFHFTLETAVNGLPKILRPIARPMISAIANPLNIDSWSILPHFINKKLSGWFTFDICRSNPCKPMMTGEIREIIREMVNIVTKHIAQRNAEQALHKAYNEMEQRVNERTTELRGINAKLQQEIIERKKAVALAKSANKAKSQFLTNVSHEIRTPLNAIIGFTEIIMQSSNFSTIHKHAKIILGESEALLSLINDLLDHSKIEAGMMILDNRPFDLWILIDQINQSMQVKSMEKNLGMEVSVESTVPQYVNGDSLRLRQILFNLIFNAIKFTEKGTVTIRVETKHQENDFVTLRFKVSDTGIGIAPDKLETIFNSFTQADGSTTRKYGGTGLGTTIAKQLVELMGGTIHVTSELGKGSTFYFEVQFKTCLEVPQQYNMSQTIERLPINTIRRKYPSTSSLLVVEDYEPNQAVILAHLDGSGHNVDIAKNGHEALHMCRLKQYDLILMDIQMPEMDGYQATRKIRLLNPHYLKCPIIAMTAHASAMARENCLDAGMNSVITKPLRRRLFLATIDTHLMGKGMSTPADMVTLEPQTQPIFETSTDKPMNYALALSEFGDSVLLERVSKQFIGIVNKQLLQIHDALKSRNLEIVRRECHSIKGGASNLEASPLANVAAQMEKSSEEKHVEKCHSLILQLEHELHRFTKFIEITTKT